MYQLFTVIRGENSIMQKQIFHTTNPDELGQYFFGDQLLNFPKYLTVLMKFVNSRKTPINFIQAFVHTESIDGEKDEVLTVETAFYNEDQTKIIRIWGAKKIDTNETLLVTIELIYPDTKQVEEEYTIIENDEEYFQQPISGIL
jgi:hypothetical protein